MSHRLQLSRVRLLALAIGLSCAAFGFEANAATYWTVPAVMKSFFSGSKRVTYKRITLPEAAANELAQKLELATVKRDWVVYVGESDGKPDGFAIVDEERGMHEPIDFAVRFSSAGIVERVEILVYREAYGDEIRGDRFRAQFRGKRSSDPITVGKDIDIVSGASISSRSIATGVRRDALILQSALKSGLL